LTAMRRALAFLSNAPSAIGSEIRKKKSDPAEKLNMERAEE
jgi:hypothetical protein